MTWMEIIQPKGKSQRSVVFVMDSDETKVFPPSKAAAQTLLQRRRPAEDQSQLQTEPVIAFLPRSE